MLDYVENGGLTPGMTKTVSVVLGHPVKTRSGLETTRIYYIIPWGVSGASHAAISGVFPVDEDEAEQGARDEAGDAVVV